MTISLAARTESGAFGLVIASSSPAVAARCLNVEAGVGAVASQNITDPRLGTAVLSLMRNGTSSTAAIEEIVRTGDPGMPAYRQLTAVDRDGIVAAFSGDRALGINGHRLAPSAVIAGNMLASDEVLDRELEAYLNSSAESLEEQLLDGLLGAVIAGGEMGPLHSAGLLVTGDVEWPVTNLPVDWSDDPAAELLELSTLCAPQRDAYVQRALNPAKSPSYGVRGGQ